MREWFFQSMGQAVGPINGAELQAKAAAGAIDRESLVRKGADGKWVKAGKVQGLIFRPVDGSAGHDAPAAAPSPDEFQPWEDLAAGFAALPLQSTAESSAIETPLPSPTADPAHANRAGTPASDQNSVGPQRMIARLSIVERVPQFIAWAIVAFVVFDYFVTFDARMKEQETAIQQAALSAYFATRLIGAYVFARVIEKITRVFA
jgi:hypothetical protein